MKLDKNAILAGTITALALILLMFASCTKEELTECYTTYEYVDIEIEGEIITIPKPKTICNE